MLIKKVPVIIKPWKSRLVNQFPKCKLRCSLKYSQVITRSRSVRVTPSSSDLCLSTLPKNNWMPKNKLLSALASTRNNPYNLLSRIPKLQLSKLFTFPYLFSTSLQLTLLHADFSLEVISKQKFRVLVFGYYNIYIFAFINKTKYLTPT